MRPICDLLQRLFLSLAVALLGLAVMAAPSGVALADDDPSAPAGCNTAVQHNMCGINVPNDTPQMCAGRDCDGTFCYCSWSGTYCYCR